MNRYLVFRKSDGAQVYDYQVEGAAIEWHGMEFDTHDHVLQAPVVDPEAPVPTVYGGRRILTRLEFLRLFTAEERIAIRVFAAGNSPYAPAVADYREMLELAENINLDDADIQAGVPTLETLGILAPGRAADILGG